MRDSDCLRTIAIFFFCDTYCNSNYAPTDTVSDVMELLALHKLQSDATRTIPFLE
nr:hypothetical protein [uncultured archaeon]